MDPKYHDPLLGVIFDLDGTLVLSPHPYGEMRREVAKIAMSYGVPPSDLDLHRTIAGLLKDAGGSMDRLGRPATDRYRFEAAVNQRLDEMELATLPQTRARAGALELLQALKERGFRIGLLTRSSAVYARQALQNAHLLPYIEAMGTRTDVGPVKPDPESMRRVLRALGVQPHRAAYVGDHPMDAQCASAAGVRFYGVLTETPSVLGTEVERFRAAGANAIARDLAEVARHLGVAAPMVGSR
ncbi:MAG: HAD family hydrolase [Thermoplasmata archaeon]|nr:HAD family hydrolase [Thermoplasmata archaeon]